MTSSYRPPGVNPRPEVTSLASRRVVEIPMDAVTQGALEAALEHFSVAVNDNYEA